MAAVQFDELRARHEARELAAVRDRHDLVMTAVQHQQRAAIGCEGLSAVERVADEERWRQESRRKIGDAGEGGFQDQARYRPIGGQADRGPAAELSAVRDDSLRIGATVCSGPVVERVH